MLVSFESCALAQSHLLASSSYFSSSIALMQTSGELEAATAADARVMIQKNGFKKNERGGFPASAFHDEWDKLLE